VKRTATVIAAIISAYGAVWPAAARNADEGRTPFPPAMQRLVECRAITEATARLSCFDTAAAGLQSSVEQRDVLVVDREQVRSARRSLFGLTLPRLGIFGGGDDATREEEEFSQIDTTVQSASMRDYAWSLVLADGARWQQIDSRPLAVAPRSGTPIVIRRAALGSFIARVGGQPGIRVRRVN